MAIDAAVSIRPSFLAAGGLSGLAGTAILSLMMVPIPSSVRGFAVIAVAAACGLAIRRYALLRGKRSIIAIKPLPAGNCVVKDRFGEETEASILPDSVVWSWVLLLRVALDGQRWPVIIFLMRDNLADEDWRRLSIWLRWHAIGRAA